MKVLARLWREQRVALVAFGLAAVLALFFAVKLLVLTIYWSDPAHRHVDPAPWMTAGYLARSWHVSREDLDPVLGVERVGRVPLKDIAAMTGKPVEQLIDELRAALPAMTAHHMGN